MNLVYRYKHKVKFSADYYKSKIPWHKLLSYTIETSTSRVPMLNFDGPTDRVYTTITHYVKLVFQDLLTAIEEDSLSYSKYRSIEFNNMILKKPTVVSIKTNVDKTRTITLVTSDIKYLI